MGARVNGKLVPLNSVLQNGDTVEILTSKSDGAGPSQDWLKFVKSQRAKNKIRLWFNKNRREMDIEKGRDQIAKVFKGKNLPIKRMLSSEILLEVADELKQKTVDDLYQAVGRGDFTAQTVMNHILAKQKDDIVDEIIDEHEQNMTSLRDSALTTVDPNVRKVNPGIAVSGVESDNDVWIKLAKCCTPVPGDAIVGFVTRGQGVSIHRQDCYNVSVLRKEVEPSRFIDANWIKGAKTSFLVQVQVEGLDRDSLLSDVLRVIGDNHATISSANAEVTKDRLAILKFTFEFADQQHLASTMAAIRKINGVYDVYRVTGRRVDK
jgi:GTP pyrophosphokinase